MLTLDSAPVCRLAIRSATKVINKKDVLQINKEDIRCYISGQEASYAEIDGGNAMGRRLETEMKYEVAAEVSLNFDYTGE